MNLKKKKKLVSRALKVGIGRVRLNPEMREEIKEAITRQDIKDLKKEKIIKVKEKRGRKKKKKRKIKKRQGKRKKKTRKGKKDYVKLTRKLRKYIKNLKTRNKISKERYYELRKKIRSKVFRDFAHLKASIEEK